MTWGAIGGAAIATVGGAMLNSGGGGGGSSTSTNKVELDPRMLDILYGKGRSLKPGVTPIYGPSTPDSQQWIADDGGDGSGGYWKTIQGTQGSPLNPESDYTNDSGLLGRITGLLGQGQNAGMSRFGTGIDNYLNDYGRGQFDNNMRSAVSLQNSDISAPTITSAQIDAPSQNNLNLSPAYQNMIYGDPAQNPYLTGAIQKGLNQANDNFANLQTDTTRNLLENILPNIRGGAIVNGQMGGSRQGIAEGRALNDFSTQMGRALSQVGQNGQDAAVSAQAGAFDNGQNRALSAMSGLGAQQYGVAQQNAQLGQQAALANQQAQLATNNLNSANQQSGIGLSSGLLGQAYNYGTNQDSYDMNKVGKVAGMLSPFTGLGSTSTSSQPLYENKMSGILGGAMLGSQIGKGLNFGGSNNITSPYDPIFSSGGF